MKIALLARDSPPARQLAHRIASRWDLRLIVSEAGRSARRRKLKRELRRHFPWRLPLTLVDLAALWLFERRWKAFVRNSTSSDHASSWPSGPRVVYVDDVNDAASVAALREAEADVVLVLGTAILRAEVLSVPARHLLNIHGGIVPRYRNVHSEFWAVTRGDVGNVGVSILHLDEGIDSGAVALQRRLEVDAGEPLFSIRLRNVQLAIDTALEALALADAGELPAEPQEPTEAGFHRTPGARDLFRHLMTHRPSATRKA